MLSARDFLRAAEQRFTTAQFLLDHDYTLDALYLAGYSVECALKTLLLSLTPHDELEESYARISSGASMHQWETLNQLLRERGVTMPLDLVRRLRRFRWSTTLRYESGRRRSGEVRGYLRLADHVLEWVRETMP